MLSTSVPELLVILLKINQKDKLFEPGIKL